MPIHVRHVHDVREAEHRLQVPPLQTAQALVEEPARRAVPEPRSEEPERPALEQPAGKPELMRQVEGQGPVRQAVPEPELQLQNPKALRTGNSDA